MSTHLNQLNAEPAARYALALSLGLAQFIPNDQTGMPSLLAQGDAEMYANQRRASEREAR